VGQALAGQQAGGGGEVAQRTLQMGQRDVLALVESEARARQAAEEALGSRVLSLQRSVGELQAAAQAAAAVAQAQQAASPRRKGSRDPHEVAVDAALDARAVVTKPILETYLSGIRSALEGEGAAVTGECFLVTLKCKQDNSQIAMVGSHIGIEFDGLVNQFGSVGGSIFLMLEKTQQMQGITVQGLVRQYLLVPAFGNV
jgi:hypothetical protein